MPAKALRFVPSDITAQQRKELPAQHVYVRGGDGTLTVREVTTGISNGVQTEVTSGLAAGDCIVVGLAAADNDEGDISVSISM